MKDDKSGTLPAYAKIETALDVASFVASAVPWMGGPISNVLSGFSNQRKLRRIHAVLQGVVSDLSTFSHEASKSYVKTEEFEDLLEQTLRKVGDEAMEQKRRLYRTFLTDTVKCAGGHYEERRRFLRCLEEIQTDYLPILRLLMSGDYQFPSLDHDLSKQGEEMPRERIREILLHLENLGLTIEMEQTKATRLTPFGTRFMRFIQA